MNNLKIHSFVSSFLIIIVISTILTLSFANFSALADSDVTNPEASPSTSTTVYLPLIKQKPAFYISPTGNDALAGTSEATAWATFNHAWKYLYPGDTLILLDGVYRQSLNPNVRNGKPGQPITIRAKNDGKAIIDGENVRIPVKLGDTWPGPIGDYFTIEGIVARNSSYHVIWVVGGDHNILRRISGYNANTDANAHVITIVSAEHNLVEDCIAAGTGRKMALIYQAKNNTIRRCFTDWREWDGREWGSCWPWGEGLEIYGGSYNTIENSIAYGHVSRAGISVIAQGSQQAIGNKILGSMSILSGMETNGTRMVWGSTRPQPTVYTCVQDFDNWPALRSGFRVGDNGEIRDNLWQDIFALNSAGLGLTFHQGGITQPIANNRVVRATIVNNGLDNRFQYGGLDTDAIQYQLTDLFTSVEDSKIENIFINYNPDGSRNLTSMNGEGARLTQRYVDGVMTNTPLWPWSMETRIQAELGISVTNLMTDLIFNTSNLSEIYPENQAANR